MAMGKTPDDGSLPTTSDVEEDMALTEEDSSEDGSGIEEETRRRTEGSGDYEEPEDGEELPVDVDGLPPDLEEEEDAETVSLHAGDVRRGSEADTDVASGPWSFPVRVCLPMDAMPASEAKTYIDDLIKTADGRVAKMVRCVRVPGADYETPMREIIFDVELLPSSDQISKQSRLAKFLASFSQASAGGLHNQVFLELPHLLSVFNRVINFDNSLRVQYVSVGSSPNPGLYFARGNYTARGNTEVSNEELGHLKSKFPLKPGGGNRSLTSLLELEHDRREMKVKFAVRLAQPEADGLRYHGRDMRVSYSSISAVRVDAMAQVINIFFLLKNPPLLYEPQYREQNGRRTLDISFMRQCTRVLDWPADEGRSEGCSRSALAKSSVLLLGIQRKKEHDLTNRIYSSIARMQARNSTIKVYFGAVAMMPRKPPSYLPLPALSSFRASYALNAILSRGYVVEDELFDARKTAEENGQQCFFLKHIQWCMKECSAACEDALELVLAALDEKRNISIVRAFDKLYNSRLELYRLCQEMHRPVEATRNIPPNCVLVRKLTVTPSRVLPMPPDVMMTNRVVRQFGAESALRVVFRDDNGQKIRANDFSGQEAFSSILQSLIKGTMCKPVRLCDREYHFLAWSNSQMRDHGFYMYSNSTLPNGEIATIDTIREWMGDFSMSKTVPKMMSRMGQCFTQALPTVMLQPEEWTMERDVEGGTGHPETKEPYTFSDGVGRLSLGLARILAEKLELDIVPSCFQVRFKGFKGVLTIDRSLDAIGSPKVIFRKSQKKFVDSDEGEASLLEVVKYAMPSSMCLNRPLITILDFVSEKQGEKIHASMCGRIHFYLEEELCTLSQMLLHDSWAATVLSDRLPVSIDFRHLLHSGFSLTDEPFFREMLVALYRYSVSQHLAKAKLELPGAKGRSMFGVMDETGLLQYGQVFIQYSPGLRSASNDPIVHLGPVLVSKNPCHVAGDARVFTAVWQPALSHMSDVIVFPRYGPRPHPDEMAGSDLDGDEYSVMFDPGMLLDHNEEAMIFPKLTAPEMSTMPTTEDMGDFFLTYLQQDLVGKVSNAHLYMADYNGLFSDQCESLARKCSIAVDFPKSGQPVENLTQEEKVDCYPDFAENRNMPTYRSTRLNGQLFRRVKKIEDVIELCERSESLFDNKIDEVLYKANYGEENPSRLREARRLVNEYAAEMQQLMDEYGISSEAAIVSGKLVNPKRLAAMEKDDYSFYNTDKIVELRYGKMWEKYRRRFFEEFGEEEEMYDMGTDGKLRIQTDSIMRDKARAWYIAAYVDDNNYGEDGAQVRLTHRPCKSFAWIVWDVLAALKFEEQLMNRAAQSTVQTLSPVPRKLTEQMRTFLNERGPDLVDFGVALQQEDEIIGRYKSVYGPELEQILFVLDCWLNNAGFSDSQKNRCPLRTSHLARLLIQFCLGILHTASEVPAPLKKTVYFARKLPYSANRCETLDFSGAIREPGECLLAFLAYIGSAAFHAVTMVDLSLEVEEGGAPSDSPEPVLFRPYYWRPLSQLAFKTIHEIAVSGHFAALGIAESTVVSVVKESADPLIYKKDSFMVSGLKEKLMEWSGVEKMDYRSAKDSIITPVGTPAAIQRLTRLLQLPEKELRIAVAQGRPPLVTYDESF